MNNYQRARLLRDLTEHIHRIKLVHSKHRGWLAIGVTIAVGLAGVLYSPKTATVQAATSEIATQRVWRLRPVAEIEAQIAQSDKQSYAIKWGNTLSTISLALNHQGITTSVARLAEINKIANIDLIYAGATLTLHGAGEHATVTIKNSDNVAQTFNLNPAQPAETTWQSNGKSTTGTHDQPNTTPNKDNDQPTTDQDKPNGSTDQPTGDKGNTGDTGNHETNGQDPQPGGTTTDPSVDPNTGGKTPEEILAEQEQAEKDRLALEAAKKAAELELTANLNRENNEAVTKVSQRWTELQKQKDDVTAKIAAANEALEAARETAKTAQTNYETAQTTILGKQKSLTELTDQLTTAQTQVTNLQAELNNLSAETAVENKAALLESLEQAQAKITNYQTEIAKAQETVTAAQTTAQTAKTQLDQATKNLDQTAANLASAKTKLAEVNDAIVKTPEYQEAANSQAAKALQEQIKTYDAQLDQLAKAIENYQTQLDAANEQTPSDQKTADNSAAMAQKAGKDAQVDLNDTSAQVDAVKQDVATIKQQMPVIRTINVDEAGNPLTDLTGYTKLANPKTTSSTESIDGVEKTVYTTTISYHKIVNTDVNVTKAVDEAGQTLSDSDAADSSKYHLMSTSEPVSSVTTADNGDTTTTYTTTSVYHLIKRTTEIVEQAQDEAGNAIVGDVDLDRYKLMSTSEPVDTDVTADNGDVTTTRTTVKTYHEIQTFNQNETENQDEDGNPLTDLTGYVKVAESEPEWTTSIDEATGDITNIYTTTVTYHKIAESDKTVTVAVDEAGNVLTGSIDPTKYSQVSTSDPVKTTETAENGDITNVYTTTVTYHAIKHEVKEVIVNQDEAGNVLAGAIDSKVYHKLSETKSEPVVEKLDNGDTISTVTVTAVYHKIKITEIAETTLMNKTTGDRLPADADLSGYTEVSRSKPYVDDVVDEATGDITRTTYVTITYVVKTNNDEIMSSIVSTDTSIVDELNQQVKGRDESVWVDQAKSVTNADLTQMVAERFLAKANQERQDQGYATAQLSASTSATVDATVRAVEGAFKFSHDRPENIATEPHDYTAADNAGQTTIMTYTSENLSQTAMPTGYYPTADSLADGIANAMYNQYIEKERNASAASRGHYANIIEGDFQNMAVGVFVYRSGNTYAVTTAVLLGHDMPSPFG